MLRGDNVKDDRTRRVCLSNQRSKKSRQHMSSSQNDAVSAYTQVNIKDASKLLKLPTKECSFVWTRLSRNRRPADCDNISDPAFSLNRNFYGHQLADLLWESNIEELFIQENVRNMVSVFPFIEQVKLFLSVYVDDIKMIGCKESSAPMWRRLRKNLDLEDPTPIVDKVHLGCTDGAAAIDEDKLVSNHHTSNVDERNTKRNRISRNSKSFGLELRYERARRTMR